MSTEVALPAKVTWLGHAALVLRKDLAIERRTGEVTTTAGFFALLVVVLSSVAFTVGDSRLSVSPGVVWISVAFAAVLAIGRSWHREREESALLGLIVSPVPPSALFAGKAAGIFVFLCAVELMVVPAVALLFSLDLPALAPGLALIALGATPGIAASGTLFGAMTVRTRARDLVLASVLFPLLSPTLLAAVGATRELVGGASIAELWDYLLLMSAFDVVFALGGLTLFSALVEG
ncbi:MAG: heme exporter protein CcmB [Polyangiaceae bacterium]|nr:heme exporter protein CcmB [Polyangiaceae bacterium]